MIGAGVFLHRLQALARVFKLSEEGENRQKQRIGQDVLAKLIAELAHEAAITVVLNPEQGGPQTHSQQVHHQHMHG